MHNVLPNVLLEPASGFSIRRNSGHGYKARHGPAMRPYPGAQGDQG